MRPSRSGWSRASDRAVIGVDDPFCAAIADRLAAQGRPVTRISTTGVQTLRRLWLSTVAHRRAHERPGALRPRATSPAFPVSADVTTARTPPLRSPRLGRLCWTNTMALARERSRHGGQS